MINYKKLRLIMCIQNLYSKYFGKIEYIITIANVSGDIERHNLLTIKDVNKFVTEINKETYWNVQKIEKFRRYKFVYRKEIIHSPLWFCLDDVTEKEYVENHDHHYSFLKKHESLNNINRVYSKQHYTKVIS